MRIISSVCTVTSCAAVSFILGDPSAATAELPFVNVRTPSPPLRCEVGSDDRSGVPGMGPYVVCQTDGFPQAPMDPPPYPGWHGDPSTLRSDQAVITASGEFSWRTANLGIAPAGQPDTAWWPDGSTTSKAGR